MATTMLVAACAAGGVEVEGSDDDGTSAGGTADTVASSGSTGGSGGEVEPECTNSAYCTHLTDTCNRGVCVDGQCITEPQNEGMECDDENICTVTGICSQGTCAPGEMIDCSELDDDCGQGVCDPTTGCVRAPANEGMPCDDGLFCTSGDVCDDAGNCTGPDAYVCPDSMQACATPVCDEDADGCIDEPLTVCADNDFCCPAGCTIANDNDCNCSVNLAPMATPTSSGGGTTSYGPTAMNDGVTEPTCAFHWISNDEIADGAFIEYTWPSAVTIGSTYITTTSASASPCGPNGRNVFSGTVQWWDGATWVTSTSFTGQLDDVAITLPTPVTTTRLRIYDMTTSPGNGNSMIHEWHVYPGAGCMP